MEVDPEFIFVTGWNEWVAGRFEHWQGVDNAFPDQFNDYFSRDIEPSKGQLKDHYYYQLVSYIRRFKGTRPLPEASAPVTIPMNGSAETWDAVRPTYYAYRGNTGPRDCDGYLTTHYTDTSGRNDIVAAKVARDRDNVYFYVECADDITSSDDPCWMRLLLSTGEGTAWESCNFILNRTKAGILERSAGGWNWETVGEVSVNVTGKTLTAAIPRAMLGIGEGGFTLRFKWADNNLAEDEHGQADILDLYRYGDSAPGGRFLYRYEAND